ncbi:flagellar hook-length control protein FliK [Dyella tabacisoli]|uniref:Flagellar hook-length control protein FliK n=1 Tax=Dyella tabacisoli TaxID=2282381 RepID=A0A369UNA9_9GAMM|nr:flagellar hook-length control protein FliK [Dyella tabacisoli]RDD79799.1 flagellar hook-length control protein FliK [Dyella tabacisoli]
MIIQPTSLAALTWAGAAAGSSAESWRIGNVLLARPLGTSAQGLLVLQIGALTVTTETPDNPLPPQFQVRVLSLGAQPLLEVLAPASPEQAVQRVLRERLPQQNGYAPLLATLTTLAQRPVLRQLPPPLRTALALLEHSIRTPEEIRSGPGLREAVLRSGLFLETQLASADSPDAALGEDDWKAALLRLSSLLQAGGHVPKPATGGPETAPPLQHRGLQAQPRALPVIAELVDNLVENDQPIDLHPLLGRLHADVHAALARLEVAQLESTATAAWIVEIPLQGEHGQDVLQLQLEHSASSEDSASWTLGFALDLPPLGPLQGELQLRGLRLSVRLWAQHAATVQKLEDRFTQLRHAVAANGLSLDQLSCQVGLPQTGQSRHAVLLKTTA